MALTKFSNCPPQASHEPDGSLTFFSAIDEGLVLTLAEPVDMVAHLREEMAGLSEDGRPAVILAFDCFFRRIEAEGRQLSREISEVLMQNGVWGLSTYGEQVGAMRRHGHETTVPPTGASITRARREFDDRGVRARRHSR